ncbi:MAG: hypothetical protein ACRDPH_03290 [Marmoricola sp.]
MKLLIGTFFYSIASALLPFLNLEAFLGVVAAELPHLSTWAVASVGAGGQLIGKVLWFFAGRESLRLSWIRKKMETPKWQQSYLKWETRIHGRPAVAGVICFGSAVSGFPPLAIVAVLAGSLRMNLLVFVGSVLAGRTIRFWIVLAGVGFLFHH